MTIHRGVAQFGSASALGAEGRRFESCRLDHNVETKKMSPTKSPNISGFFATAEQREAARQTDLVALLQSQGEHLKRSGKEYVWRDGSEKVTVRGNLWFHQYERIGGDAVDFVRRFYNMDFPQAVNFLLGNNGGIIQRAEPVKQEPKKPFELPPQNENMRRVYAYLLNRRGIDREVLSAFVHKGMIYESADYHNAVFVGY